MWRNLLLIASLGFSGWTYFQAKLCEYRARADVAKAEDLIDAAGSAFDVLNGCYTQCAVMGRWQLKLAKDRWEQPRVDPE